MHGLDLAMGCNRRVREPFDATVVRIGLGPRHQLGEGRGGNALRLSKKELRKRGHQNMLHAWQTNSSEKGKRERPDLGVPSYLSRSNWSATRGACSGDLSYGALSWKDAEHYRLGLPRVGGAGRDQSSLR